MKWRIDFVFIALCIWGLAPVTGQKLYQKETGWPKQLWLGGGFNLSFGSALLGPYQGNLFTIGISPMVGLKTNSFLSVGPRIELSYTTGRFDVIQGIAKYNSTNFGGGVFSRAKFLRNFFAHIEYSVLSEEFPVSITVEKVETIREWRDIFLLGLGYNSGEDFAYEIYLNYNFLHDENSNQLPIIYRLGFTYNF